MTSSTDQNKHPVIAMIVAVARNGVIGHDGGLPWRLSSDLKMFRRLTMGKPLIMGRRTFQSLKMPLDGRDNIVVSRDPEFVPEGAIVVATVDDAVFIAHECARQRNADEIMVIGGAQIYEATRDVVSRVYWTAVDAEPAGDTSFPPLDRADWAEVGGETIERGPRDEHDARLIIFERIAQPAD